MDSKLGGIGTVIRGKNLRRRPHRDGKCEYLEQKTDKSLGKAHGVSS